MKKQLCLLLNYEDPSYDINECSRTLTVRELVDILQAYSEDTPVYLTSNWHYGGDSLIAPIGQGSRGIMLDGDIIEYYKEEQQQEK